MPINWTDNKVFNSNPQQRTAYNTKAPMQPAPQMENIQMSHKMSVQGDTMNAKDMTGGQMMNERMMNSDEMNGDMMFQQGPPPVMDKHYLAGYLAANIGKNVRAEFALPGGFFIDKAGILREVGVNYFVLEDNISHARIVCDLYSVKFLTIL